MKLTAKRITSISAHTASCISKVEVHGNVKVFYMHHEYDKADLIVTSDLGMFAITSLAWYEETPRVYVDEAPAGAVVGIEYMLCGQGAGYLTTEALVK